MPKTPEYTKKAVNAYREKFDFIQVRFPKGTKERLAEKGNINDYICNLVLSDLGDGKVTPDTAEQQKESKLDFSTYEERKAETENLQTIEELNAYVLRMQEENAKQPKKEPETVGEIIESTANSDEKPKDDELTNLLNGIRARRAEAAKDK